MDNPKYEVTAYFKKCHTTNKNKAIQQARDWALKTGKWGKVTKVKRNSKNKLYAGEQVYICNIYEGFQESFERV